MSKVRGYLPLTFLLVLLVAGCTPGVATPSPTATMTPTHAPIPVPTPTPTATPSPTPTVDVVTVMQEVRDGLAEAAAFEEEQDFQAAQESAFQALALYLSLPETEEMSEEEIEEELFSLSEEAGVEIGVMGIDLLRVEPTLYLVKFGLHPIALFWGQGAPLKYFVVAEGDVIKEARLTDNELGVIFAYVGASTVTPDFTLLRREEDGWRKVWPSDLEPWRDLWRTADGEVSFAAAQDLSLLRMEGSSWGVFLEEAPFFECHACPHRFFDLLWERQGDEYLPQVTLPHDAPYYDRLWEITQPSPYASLFEFLRRLRAGDETGALQLASNPSVVEEAQALGLDDPTVTYMIEWERAPEETLLFSTEDMTRKFIATFVQPGAGEHWLLTDIGER